MKSKLFEINVKHNIRCKIYFEDKCNPDKIVIFFHGFCGHKDNKAAERFAMAATSKDKGIGVIVFNLPCHGDDIKKKLLLSDCNDYISAVIDYAMHEFGTDEIYAYGTSFGAYLVLKYLHEHTNPFKRIAFRCPGIHMYDELTKVLLNEDHYRLLAKGKEILIGFDRKITVNKAFLDDLKNNDISQYDYIDYADDILIIHGLKDEIVPIESVRDFCDRNVIELIEAESADHRFSNVNELNLANHKILEFLLNGEI